MRIVIDQALAALRQEERLLDAQSQRCQREMNKFAGFCLQDMAGASVTAAEQRMRMQASVAQAHLAFCRELCVADRKNEQLVQALPTTSPGVLDTLVAQERIYEAEECMRSLERQLDDDLARAQRTMGAGSAGCVNTSAIHQRYTIRLADQKKLVADNEEILERAQEYERAAAEAYAAVNVSCLAQASASAERYAQEGSWGSTTWAAQLRLSTLASAYQSERAAQENSLGERFLRRELQVEGALFSQEWEGASEFADLVVESEFEGAVASFSAGFVPYTRQASGTGSSKGDSYGARAKAQASAAEFSFENDVGLLSLDETAELLTGTVSGTLGVSLIKGGSFAPVLSAVAKAEGSVLSNTTSASVGVRDYNLHGQAEMEALTASAKAGVSLSEKKGLALEAGGEAYLFSGEFSGGFSLLGVDVDLTVEGNVGGAGAKAGLQGGLNSVSGELGLGLGLGAGARVEVDWSNAAEAIGDGWNALESWWSDLQKD